MFFLLASFELMSNSSVALQTHAWVLNALLMASVFIPPPDGTSGPLNPFTSGESYSFVKPPPPLSPRGEMQKFGITTGAAEVLRTPQSAIFSCLLCPLWLWRENLADNVHVL